MERKEWIMKRLGVSSWEDAKQELEDCYPEIFEWALEEQSSVSAVECMHQHVHEARRWIFFLEERLDDLDEVTKDSEATRRVLDELIFVPSGKIIPHLTTALFAAQLHLADKGAGSGESGSATLTQSEQSNVATHSCSETRASIQTTRDELLSSIPRVHEQVKNMLGAVDFYFRCDQLVDESEIRVGCDRHISEEFFLDQCEMLRKSFSSFAYALDNLKKRPNHFATSLEPELSH